MLHYLLPWQFSPAWTIACLGALVVYARGAWVLRRRGRRVGPVRATVFALGVVAIYAVTQTYYDYLAQYMFFAHRVQHLVLHHAAPFLIALAAPWPILAAGCGTALRSVPGRERIAAVLRVAYRTLQQPVIAPLLFVGLVYFWLFPPVHFDAMLSRPLYHVMNWSMALDGLLFWWLMLDPRPKEQGGLGYGWRIATLLAIAPPQIALGAYIAFSDRVLFDVYSVCGRAWPIAPLDDQTIGGLLTWIPAAMMSVLGVLVVLGYILNTHRRTGTGALATGREGDAAT